MPGLAALISSGRLLKLRRIVSESKRRLLRRPHNIEIYLKLTDPYSYLLLQVLPDLAARYPLKYQFYLLDNLPAAMFPEPDLWQQHALKDAGHLARLYQLTYPQPLLMNPEAEQVLAYQGELLGCRDLASILSLFHRFWQGKPLLPEQAIKPMTGARQVQDSITANLKRLTKKGHYQSAMLRYGAEWYWGIDRLWFLEQRLIQLGLAQGDVLFDRQFVSEKVNDKKPLLYPPADKLPPLVLYFSMRSPYSYLGLEQAKALAEKYRLKLELKPVLPMVMRGLQVPNMKKMYIFHDTKREAVRLGLPYGKVADPLGLAVEYCYALFDYAKKEGKDLVFICQFARAVNSQGLYCDNQQALQQIIESCGLDWQQAKAFLSDNRWRQWANQHQQELKALGQWGVPCFQWGETLVWGQDRLWVIEKQLEQLHFGNIADTAISDVHGSENRVN